jgi:hypothetical protein
LLLCSFAPCNLYFKSILDFTVLKLNDTELSNLVTELFFFEGQRLKVTKVQRINKLTKILGHVLNP